MGCHFLLQRVKVKSLSRVRLLAIPWTAAYQAPLSMGVSRQEYWSGSPVPSPKHSMLLSHFSCVRLCATPETAAHQAPRSLGFSRQEHWSGLPFPSPTRESEVAQLRPTLRDPMDCSLPGSSVHGIFQARVLEWGAIMPALFTGVPSSKRYPVLTNFQGSQRGKLVK